MIHPLWRWNMREGLFWLDDLQWHSIKGVLPGRKRRGPRRVDDRRVISGIIHVLQSVMRKRIRARPATSTNPAEATNGAPTNSLTTQETTSVVATPGKCWAAPTLRESKPNIFWNCTLLGLAARESGKFRLVRFLCNGCTFPSQFHRNVYIRCFLPFLFPYIVNSRRPFCLHIPGR
jgi:hypothetical protein